MSRRTRRRFLGESIAALGTALMAGTRHGEAGGRGSRRRAPERPNILLVITDQQRIDTLGFRGLTPCRTPHLDRLAREGISFDRCLTPTPICLPARTALFTSQYGHQTQTMANSDTLESDPVLLTRFRDLGYQVDYAGKWGMGDAPRDGWVDRIEAESRTEYSRWCASQGIPDGWAFNDPAMRSHRRDDVSIPKPAVNPITPAQTNEAWTVDHAIRLLDSRDRRRPFFLTCSLNGPHPPFKIPEPYYSMYDPRGIPKPANFGPSPGEPAALARSFYRTVFLDHGSTWDAWQRTVAVYWGFVTMVDAEIGRLVGRLEREDLLDDTLVVVTTDHGEMLGQHGLWQKYHAYEEALRIPLIMRAPWLIRPGVRSSASSSLIDVAPTVFAACGIAGDPSAEGTDLSFAFSGQSEIGATNRLMFSEFKPKADWHGVVDWRLVTDNVHKYVWNKGDIDELYDLSADPHELTNRAALPAAAVLVRRFRAELLAWMRRTGDPLADDFERERGSGSA